MMPEQQTAEQRKTEIKDAAMASLVKMPLIGGLINKLSESVEANQSAIGQVQINQSSQATLIEKQNAVLSQVSKDINAMLRGVMKQVGILKDIKQNKKEQQRQAFFKAQQQAVSAEEALMETKRDAVPVAGNKGKEATTQDKGFGSLFGLIGSLLTSITGLVGSVLALPGKISAIFKTLMSFKTVLRVLPKIARFFLMNPIGAGLLLGTLTIVKLIDLLAKDKNPEETTKGIINAGTPDTAMATAITEAASAPDAEVERKKQKILADRPSNKKSYVPWKDSDLQQAYLKEIGWDQKTGTTAQERQQQQTASNSRADARRLDNQQEATSTPVATKAATESQTSPNQQMAVPDKPATFAEEPKTTPIAPAPTSGATPIAPAPTSGANISEASTNVESMYSKLSQNKQGGVVVNTTNDSMSAAPKRRAPIPSPVANRGSIDKFAFSVA